MYSLKIAFPLALFFSAIALAGEAGEESDATLERQLQILSQIRSIAQENAKRISKDWSMPADLDRRIKSALPNTLTSQDLFALALLCRIAQGSGPAEDHRYTDVFFRAEIHCAWLFIDRPDGPYWLKRLRCGIEGGRAVLLDEDIMAAEKRRKEKNSR